MIYLVDDQEFFLKTLKIRYSDRIRVFNHPNDAFLALLSERPSLLITDVFMPMKLSKNLPPQGMDGLTLAEIVKANMPETNIVIISGNDRAEIEEKYPGKLSGFKYFFNKPLEDDFHTLVSKLESENHFIPVSLMLKPKEVELLKGVEGKSLAEKVLYIVRQYRPKN